LVSTITGTDAGLSASELAGKYGLTVAGARPPMFVYIRKLWSFRFFIGTYATSIISASFSKARLGRLWQVLTPLSNAAVYYLIFGVVLGTKRGVPNFITYLCIGVFVFGFISQSAIAGVQAITRNITMIRALHFPRATMSIATTWTQLQNFLASMIVLFAIALGTGEPISRYWLIIPPAVALMLMFNTGLGFICARLGSKVTDLRHLLPFITRTWMYLSGVFYSATTFDRNLPGPFAAIAKANPAVVYIDLVRHALLRRDAHAKAYHWVWPMPTTWALAVGWGVITLVVGFIYFWKGEELYGRG
jgi:teichoic acid transport system permease protein